MQKIFSLIVALQLLSQANAEARDTLRPQPSRILAQNTSADSPIRDKWAVVVGISKFTNPALNLRYPNKDARDFYNYLITDAGFAKDHVLLLLDEQATRANVLSAIGGKWLPHCVLPDDLVMIYVSTHGSSPDAKVDGVNYIVAHDSDPDDLYATGIAMQDLTRIIKGKVSSDRVVMLLDACHSGTVAPEGKGLVRATNLDADSVLQGCGQIVISSSEPGQVSWESKEYENSVFTRRLVEGLKSKGKHTTIDDAFQYMKDQTQEEVTRDRGSLQTPVMKSKWEGKQLVLAIPPAQPRAGLPAPFTTMSNASPAPSANTPPPVPTTPPVVTQPSPAPATSYAPVTASIPITEPASTSTATPAHAAHAAKVQLKVIYFNLELIKSTVSEFTAAGTTKTTAESTLRKRVEDINTELQQMQNRGIGRSEIERRARESQTELNAQQKALIDLVQAQESTATRKLSETALSAMKELGADICISGSGVYSGGQAVVDNGVDVTNSILAKLGAQQVGEVRGPREPHAISLSLGYFNLAMVKQRKPDSREDNALVSAENYRLQSEDTLRKMVSDGNKSLTDAQSAHKPKEEIERMARELQQTINREQQRLIADNTGRSSAANKKLATMINSIAQKHGIVLTVDGAAVYAGGAKFTQNGIDLTNEIMDDFR